MQIFNYIIYHNQIQIIHINPGKRFENHTPDKWSTSLFDSLMFPLNIE